MTRLWALLWGLRNDGDIIWLLTKAIESLKLIADTDNRRDTVGVFLREAEIRAKVRGFDEAMGRVPRVRK